jgi:hypothetical protein
MKRVVYCLSVLMLATQLTLASSQLKNPPLGDRESGAAAATESGKARWRNQWTMERVTSDGKPAIHFVETGQGTYSPFKEDVRWKSESWWLNDADFRPLRFEKTFTDASGKALMRETAVFDWTKRVARFERQDLRTGSRTEQSIAVPDDTLSVEGIAAALRAVPFVKGTKVSAHLLSNEPRLYEITIEVDKRETCRTARGAVDCFRVELIPHLGALDLFRFAFPKTYFWYSAEKGHEWLRYEGLEAGQGTPEIVMEPAGKKTPTSN